MPASVRLAAASAVAAALFFSALPAQSADLYAPRYGSAYDDPSYADFFDDDRPAVKHYAEPDDDFDEPYQRRHAYKDDFGNDFRDDTFDRRYDRYARRGDGCVSRRIAHERIRADGWRDFGDFEARGNLVYMRARRPSGRLFDLTIDTCSGEIIEARPLLGGRSYAGGPRRYRPNY